MSAISLNISVIIPLYNAEQFIAKALESCLQFSEIKEILVIDDGYKDKAREIVEQYAQDHFEIKLFQHPNRENRGAGASRNLGLKNATQEYIAFLDADDYFLPNRFDAEKLLFKNPDVEGVYGAIGVHFYNQIGRENFIKKFKIKEKDDPEDYLTTVNRNINPEDLFFHLWGIEKEFLGYFSLDGLTIKKTVIQEHQLFFNENLRLHQDTEFISKLAYVARLHTGNFKEAVAVRGVHEKNRYVSNDDDRKVIKNRYLLYDESFKWLKERKASQKVLRHFEVTADYFDFKLSNYWSRKRKYLLYISKYKGFLNSDKFPIDHIHRGLFQFYPFQKIYLYTLNAYRKIF